MVKYINGAEDKLKLPSFKSSRYLQLYSYGGYLVFSWVYPSKVRRNSNESPI